MVKSPTFANKVFLAAIGLLVVFAVPAHAYVFIPAEPQPAEAFPVGIQGEFSVIGAAEIVLVGDGPGGGGGTGCPGCHARHNMYWTDYGLYEYVGVKEVHAISEQAIDRITAHAALIHGTSDCYEGNYYWTGDFDKTNTKGWTYKNSAKWGTGYNDTYTLAGGRSWYNRGVKYRLAGGQDAIDICKKF